MQGEGARGKGQGVREEEKDPNCCSVREERLRSSAS